MIRGTAHNARGRAVESFYYVDPTTQTTLDDGDSGVTLSVDAPAYWAQHTDGGIGGDYYTTGAASAEAEWQVTVEAGKRYEVFASWEADSSTGSDALGNETTYTYDALGRSIAVTTPDPDGAGTTYTSLSSRTYYNDDAQFGASISPDGRVDTPRYDQLGRRTASYVGQVITPDIGAYAEPSGIWSDATGGPFDGGYRTVLSVTGSATAKTTWTFDHLIPGEQYKVYVTWTSDAANTTDAHFSVYSGSRSGTLLDESDLDQTADPTQASGFRGFSDQPFELLATVTPSVSDPTTLVVQLSNEGATASKTVVADAVYVVRTSPTSQSVYDFAGRLDASINAAGNQTDYVYDNLGRQTSITDPESGVTAYTFDVAGRMATLTDPVNNTTSWTYDSFGRKAARTINVDSTDLTRTFEYNAAGAVVQQIDRNGRVTVFTYDSLLRRTTEKWYDDINDTTANFTYTTAYNQAGRIGSIDDGDLVFDYTYTLLGNLATLTRDLDTLTGDIEFTYSHDALGRTTGITTKLGSTKDYANAYSYDNLGRLTCVTQQGQTGGNTVAEKRVDFDYTVDGRLSKTSRYADLAGTENVVETDHLFDILGRVASITHESGSSVWADYDYRWDAAGRRPPAASPTLSSTSTARPTTTTPPTPTTTRPNSTGPITPPKATRPIPTTPTATAPSPATPPATTTA